MSRLFCSKKSWIKSLGEKLFHISSRRQRPEAANRRLTYKLIIETLEDRITPSSFNVTDNTDNASDSGSIRFAVNNLAAGSSASTNTITIASGLGTILLTNGTLTLNQGVTITGSGATNLAISGGYVLNVSPGVQVFHVNAGVSATISGLTVENGNASSGAGIHNAGTLNLSYDAITNNTAMGHGNYSSGGGIWNSGTLTMSNSTVANNTAEFYGAGIVNQNTDSTGATMHLSNSTIANNSASLTGGGIGNYHGTLTMSDCTVNNNSTFGSGGGLFSTSGAVTLSNSILAGNYSHGSPGMDVFAGGTGATLTVNYTVIGVNSGFTIGSGTGNYLGVAASSVLTGPLAYNGGTTQTVALQTGSGAVTTIATGHAVLISDTTIYVQNAAAIAPTSGNFCIQIDQEQMLVTSVNLVANTLTVTRAANGTTAATHAVGETVLSFAKNTAIGTGGAVTTIATGHAIGISDTTIFVQNAALIVPSAGNFYIQIDQEQMLVTGFNLAANTLTVTRGSNATTHAVGAGVFSKNIAIGTGGALTTIATGHAVGISDTTIFVQNAALIVPTTGNFYVQIDQEQMLVTSVNLGANTLTVTRGSNATTHAVGAGVYVTTDQRGVARPTSATDIGAVQLQTVISSTALLPANSTSITINGAGFDTNPANDSVTFSNGVTGVVTAVNAAGTSLTVNLTGLGTVAGGTALMASVNVGTGSSSSAVQVATVQPVVTPSTTGLPASSISMTIAGFGFDSTAAHDSVTFSNGVTGTVASASSNSLSVNLTGLSSVPIGTALMASVTVNSISSGTAVQVATVQSASNPAPTLSSISPNSATAGASSVLITLTGTGFVSTSTADFNGTPIATVYVSAISLSAVIPASDLTSAGTDPVTVVNASPGGGTSGAQTFTINNPAPSLSSISPNSATVGASSVLITLTGTGFVSTSTADFNGTPIATVYVSAISLTAVIPASDLTAAGTEPVTVVNAGPGGGTSGSQIFTIYGPPPSITSVVINQDVSSLYFATGQPSAGVQRSMVQDIVYTFSEPVNLAGSIVDPNVFTIAVPSGSTGTLPTLNWAVAAGSDGTEWHVTFSGAGVTGNSIANGAYTITVNHPASITGQTDSQALTLTSGINGATQSFDRLFGAIRGHTYVNNADNVRFKQALTTYNVAFDVDHDGLVDATDNTAFKQSLSITFTGFTPTI